MDQLRAMLRGGSESERPPLSALFARCQAIHTNQDALVAARDAELIAAAAEELARSEAAVESAGIFSANEDRDDLSTADMKYLLVPFYRGSLLASAPVPTNAAGPGPSSLRLAAVQRALPPLGAFLQRCEQYTLLGEVGRAAMEAAAGGAMDAGARRHLKVEKFRREKALNAALAALEAKRAAAAAAAGEEDPGAPRDSSTAAGGGGSTAGGGTAGGGGGLDEEDERRLWMARIEAAVLTALDLRASMQQEVELLQHAAAREAAAASAAAASGSGSALSASGSQGRGRGEPLPPPTDAEKEALLERLRAVCRDLDGGRRERMRADVFKPGHILPTMTVEEAGEIEAREAAEREARQARQEAKEAARRAALDSDEEDAEDKAKQRSWDDWRDAHPKGYGNSKLRPCG